MVSDRWIRGQGPWFGFWYAVGYPLVTAGLYVLLVLGAIRGPDVSSTVRVLLGFAVNAPIPVLDRRGHGSGGQTDSPQPCLTDSPYSAPSDREPGS